MNKYDDMNRLHYYKWRHFNWPRMVGNALHRISINSFLPETNGCKPATITFENVFTLVVLKLFIISEHWYQYSDVIMGAITSQITSLAIVYSTVYLGTDQRKHQSSASLAFVRGIHRWSVNSPHKGPVTWKMFPFHDVIMNSLVKNTLICFVGAWYPFTMFIPFVI